MDYTFNVKEATERCIAWIHDWYAEINPTGKAVIGISGGKDSTVVANLCYQALGEDRVFGVLMPNHYQADMEDSLEVIDSLGINSTVIDIGAAVDDTLNRLPGWMTVTQQTKDNLPPRIRMATLYAVSQSMNGMVSNNCNASETYIGYSTRYGDTAGDFAPIAKFTATEVIQIGMYLGIAKHLILKAPADGLCGKTDEENLGFTYAVLDKYIRTGKIDSADTKRIIDLRHKVNKFKTMPIATFDYWAA